MSQLSALTLPVFSSLLSTYMNVLDEKLITLLPENGLIVDWIRLHNARSTCLLNLNWAFIHSRLDLLLIIILSFEGVYTKLHTWNTRHITAHNFNLIIP